MLFFRAATEEIMHPNVLRYWTEWIVEGDVQSATLVVVTDLETEPSAPGYDEAAFNAVVEAVLAQFTDHPAQSIRFIPDKADNSLVLHPH
jgi:hypothetical protein